MLKQSLACPWCGRVSSIDTDGKLEIHRGTNGIRCVGAGQPQHVVANMIQLRIIVEEKKGGGL